jgi:flagellar hook-basal body complex protein FliE
MDPLTALSALTSGSGSVQMPLTATTPSMPGAPVGEAFQLPGVDQLGLLPTMGASPAAAVAPAASGGGPSTWGHMVQQMVMDVNSKQHTAAEQVSDVLRGGPTPIHQAMISSEEAGLSFEFLNEMRNKLVDAYQQVMQMQV